MSTDNSHNQGEHRLTLYLHLAEEAAAGHLDDLECPNCRQATVKVWFTHPTADTYRTWFICAECDFHTRAQNTDRPRFFSEDRVSGSLEDRDRSVIKQAIFKRPPQRLM
jgi:hypothetical protein